MHNYLMWTNNGGNMLLVSRVQAKHVFAKLGAIACEPSIMSSQFGICALVLWNDFLAWKGGIFKFCSK